jgi:hypothetical protein
LRHGGVIARRVLAVPVLCIRPLAIVACIWIRVWPAQPGAPPQAAEGRGYDYASAEAMVMESPAVKSSSVKSAKSVAMMASKTTVESAAMEPLTMESLTMKPLAMKSALAR